MNLLATEGIDYQRCCVPDAARIYRAGLARGLPNLFLPLPNTRQVPGTATDLTLPSSKSALKTAAHLTP